MGWQGGKFFQPSPFHQKKTEPLQLHGLFRSARLPFQGIAIRPTQSQQSQLLQFQALVKPQNRDLILLLTGPGPDYLVDPEKLYF
jgi:hypothetical protein